MLRHSDLFEELPEKYHDSAFLDRLHFFIPGWEIDIIRNEMFTDGFGFIVDYFAEILKSFRDLDLANLFNEHFTLSDQISTRDRVAIKKTFSGMMKLLFPNKDASKDDISEILKFAIEGRKRVKDQLLRIDETYAAVHFAFTDTDGKETTVATLEESQYPDIYYPDGSKQADDDSSDKLPKPIMRRTTTTTKEPTAGQVIIQENQRGVRFDDLFGPYVRGASKIVLTDPLHPHVPPSTKRNGIY